MELHELLRYYRQDVLNVSQDEIARRLNTTQSSVSKYEQGGAGIDITMLPRLMEAYRVPKEEVIQSLFPDESQAAPLSIREQQEAAFESEWRRIERVFREYPSLKSDFLRLVSLPPAKYNQHAKAVAQIVKAHLSPYV